MWPPCDDKTCLCALQAHTCCKISADYPWRQSLLCQRCAVHAQGTRLPRKKHCVATAIMPWESQPVIRRIPRIAAVRVRPPSSCWARRWLLLAPAWLLWPMPPARLWPAAVRSWLQPPPHSSCHKGNAKKRICTLLRSIDN